MALIIESTALATRNIWDTIVTREAVSQASKELRKQYGEVEMRHSKGGHILSIQETEANRLVGAGERSPRVAELILRRPGRD
jgi:hypothetical protein